MAGLSLDLRLGLSRRLSGPSPTINQSAPLIIAHRCSGSMYPEYSDKSHEWAYAAGLRQLEIDGRILADGTVGVMHDATVDRTTDGTGNASAVNAAAFQALTVDYASWFGGDYGTLHPPLAFDVIDKFNGRVAFHIEGKDADAMTAIVNRLTAIGARKDQYVLSSFQLTTARIALNAGYATAVVATGATDMAALWGEGFRWVLMAVSETDALIQQYVTQGFNVLVYTLERRKDRDRYLALGVRGLYSDDAEYTSGDKPIATRDGWATLRWMPGMLGYQNRGTFAEDGWWGWPDYVGVAGCLQGWACPINGHDDANDFSIDFEARFHAVGAGTDWFGVWIADATMRDQIYTDTGATGQKGYFLLFRQNGRIQIYRRNEAATINVFTDGPAFATDGVTATKCRVRVNSTQIIGEKLDADDMVVQSAVLTDTTFRGGYLSINKVTNARPMLRNFAVSPVSAPVPGALDPAAQLLFQAMTDEPSAARVAAINTLIDTLRRWDLWDGNGLRAMWMPGAHANQASRLNWKDPSQFMLTPFNSPNFLVDRGWKGDGATSYLGSGFFPATDGGSWAVDDGSIWVWTCEEMQESVPAVGAGTGFVGAVVPRNASGNAEGLLNRTGTTLSAATSSSIGLTGIQRRGASDERLWKNGVQIASGSAASVGRPSGEFRIGGRSPSTFAGQRVSFAAVAGSLTGKETALFSALNTFMQAIGNS
ncbi:glycerophosphodiester phosphodiesterase [Chelatococcus asaccharovorans]|uniref:Glycerophosphoryl diester phosphodiesterase n=1 Tax=Chelatococcus asaccharovorans TaxID=28210 RepID=A0A2V3UCK7_9HYPH|nr:glycerophosphodiester phosphodiesterase [Chelatococcus asaccharovorans]MBS7703337.1 hypothetical protein [Chelatococcus asaccharovorans]PXW61672.1 glycerophosphoryl diester phosphodiesterase [Chelatococcus asaccharovorans]